MVAAFPVAVEATAARRAFLEHTREPLIEPGQHIVPNPVLLTDLRPKVQVFPDDGGLLRNGLQQPAVTCAVRLLGPLRTQQQRTRQTLAAVRNGNDETDAAR